METVAAVECSTYETEKVYLAVKEAIHRIGFVIPEGKTILIKPNIMSQNKPWQHTITHYSLIEGLCRIMKEKNCTILIGESIAFYQKGLTRKAFQTSEIEAVAEEYGASLIAFEEEQLVTIRNGLMGLEKLHVPKILMDVDMVINACKLKTHGTMRLSGAVKNMFGCLPGGYKQHIHQWVSNEFELADVILDIHGIVKPALSIMDAVVSLDGGPTALGRPVKTARIFASSNPAALDVTAGRMIGYDPEEVPILIQAKKRGMLENFEDIQVLGDMPTLEFKKLVKADLYRTFSRDSIFVKDTYVDLAIDDSRCNHCGKCIGACPIYGITHPDKRIELDRGPCIHCYRCLYACPQKAIRIRPSNMNRLIRGIRRITKM